jgi:hypothetical protein
MAASIFGATIVSLRMKALSIDSIEKVTSRMMPVSPHATDRRAEHLGILGPRTDKLRAVGHNQGQSFDMISEAARFVIVLAMNICGDHAANGDVSCAGHHRRKKSAWNKGVENLCQGDSSLDRQACSFAIERDHAVESCHGQCGSAADSGVAIGATSTAGNNRLLSSDPAREIIGFARREDARIGADNYPSRKSA